MILPFFLYHPDPIGTGCIRLSDSVCGACGQARGFTYTGPVYGEIVGGDEAICPWCIADGTAHAKLGAEFTDPRGVGGFGDWDAVPTEVVEQIAYRTPAFSAWQEERWYTHCSDAAEFLGVAGRLELDAFGAEATAAIRRESGLDAENWESYYKALDRNLGPSAYVFRCRHCGKYGGYSDFK